MKFYHLIWAILPLVLFIFFIRASFRQLVFKKAAEHTGELFSEGLFCGLTFLAALLLDLYWFIEFTKNLDLGPVDPSIFNWLLYPALLAFAAFFVSRIFPRKDVASLSQLRKNLKVN